MQLNVPILSLVGTSNSGKTTLIVKIVKELKSRGYRVATIKHSHHNVELDREGKDTWMHTQAGADAVVLISKNIVGLIRKSPEEISLSEMVNTHLNDMDIIIVEGYKTEAIPKIEVFRSEVSPELVCKYDKNLIAIIGDKNPETTIPFFNINDRISPIVDFLLSHVKISLIHRI